MKSESCSILQGKCSTMSCTWWYMHMMISDIVLHLPSSILLFWHLRITNVTIIYPVNSWLNDYCTYFCILINGRSHSDEIPPISARALTVLGLDATKPAIVETCMYTVTPDKLPIVDFHPQHPNVLIGAGFSGRGFKMSPEVGNILAHMAMGRAEELNYDLKKLSATRFTEKSNLWLVMRFM